MENVNQDGNLELFGETTDKQDSVLSPEDSAEFLAWVTGMTKEPPVALQKVANNLINKLNYGMSYMIAQNMTRCDKLLKFVGEAEDILFDKTDLINKDPEELKDLYATAQKNINSNLEFTRKFIVQNKDTFNPNNEKVDKLKDLIMSLPKEKLDSLIQSLQKGDI